MGGSNSNSTAASNQAAQNSQTSAGYNTAAQNLYGGITANTSAMANPNSLNVSQPTGPSALQYNNAVQNTASQYQNASGQLSRSMALRGFGADSPSGMGASLQGQMSADEANAQGQNFSNYTNQSYQTALNNFWNANQLQGQAAGQEGSLGTTGGTGAANTYANLYQTAATNNPLNKIIPAVGQVAAAAVG